MSQERKHDDQGHTRNHNHNHNHEQNHGHDHEHNQLEHEHDDNSCSCCGHDHSQESQPAILEKYHFAILVICGIGAVIAAVLHFIPIENEALHILGLIAALCAIITGLTLIAPLIWKAIKKRSINIAILMGVAVVGACALGDFAEAAFVLFLYSLGEEIEERSIEKSKTSIRRLLELAPSMVHLKRGESIVDVRAEEVELGDVVQVKPGEGIAIDGRVISGESAVDESQVTGEAIPVLKTVGSNIFSGSINTSGSFLIEATSTTKDSTLSKIVKLVEQAQKEKAPYENFINRFAKYYTPLVMVLAIIVAVVPSLLNLTILPGIGDWSFWLYNALCLLVISCPCALVISTPISIVSGLTKAAKIGVLVKGGAYLEIGAKIRAVAFDKTGTLTTGKPAVVNIVTVSDVSKEDLLAYAAAVELNSTHPLSKAIVQADKLGLREKFITQNVQELSGRGIKASVIEKVTNTKREIAIGREDFIFEGKIIDSVLPELASEDTGKARSVLFISIDGNAVGMFSVSDSLRENSASTLKILKSAIGIKCSAMLTGDNVITAAIIANRVGIDRAYAALLPEDKAKKIRELKGEFGAIAMVGDGINDAPSLAEADIGIAMGVAGSDTAIETADVALMADDIAALPMFFKLCKKVVRIIHQNVVIALAIKFGIMLTVFFGMGNMFLAVFADTGVLLIVILNSLRIRR